ncbi:MAG TPA: hypothetical protein VG204_18720 [Terriglobia bacterium]|nr:hypothetical protein [Terriglobia bacterium]
MRSKTFKSTVKTIALVVFATSIAFARSAGHGRSSHKSADVTISETTQVPNGPTLESGTYHVALIDDSSTPEVGFYQNGKLVGQAPVKLIDQGRKIDQTETSTDKRDNGTYVITELDLSGWVQKIEFGASDVSSNSGE